MSTLTIEKAKVVYSFMLNQADVTGHSKNIFLEGAVERYKIYKEI